MSGGKNPNQNPTDTPPQNTHKKKPQKDVLLYTFLPWGEDTKTKSLRCVLVTLMSEQHRRCSDNEVTNFNTANLK